MRRQRNNRAGWKHFKQVLMMSWKKCHKKYMHILRPTSFRLELTEAKGNEETRHTYRKTGIGWPIFSSGHTPTAC